MRIIHSQGILEKPGWFTDRLLMRRFMLYARHLYCVDIILETLINILEKLFPDLEMPLICFTGNAIFIYIKIASVNNLTLRRLQTFDFNLNWFGNEMLQK